MDGIIGLCVFGGQFYFQPVASNGIFALSTAILKAGPWSGIESDLPVRIVGHKSSQATVMDVDPRDGSLVFSPLAQTTLATLIPDVSASR